MKKIYAALFFFYAAALQAFPEMVRHGMLNCSQCHVDPNGGGLLTPAGRSASGPLLSQTYAEGEERAAYRLTTKLPPWLNVGGDLRLLQTHHETTERRRGRFIIMQGDLTLALTYQNYVAVASFGPHALSTPYSVRGQFFSRSHYVMTAVSPLLVLRMGRFYPSYGLHIPEHYTAIKDGLGWNMEGETYNVEAATSQTYGDVFVTANMGRPDAPSADAEKGVVGRVRYFAAGYGHLGLSYHYGANNRWRRQVFGPSALLAFSRQLVWRAEVDVQKTARPTTEVKSLPQTAQYQRLSYEFYPGIWGFMMQDFLQLEQRATHISKKYQWSYGPGLQYFPRPHWEGVLAWQHRRQTAAEIDTEELFYLMLHFYL